MITSDGCSCGSSTEPCTSRLPFGQIRPTQIPLSLRTMKTVYPASLALTVVIALTSCTAAESSATIQTPAQQQAVAPAVGSPATAAPQPIEIPPATDAPPAATAQINPPHGEPGHRCEIPVGAPLDGSAPSAPAASTVTIPANGTTASPVMAAPTASPATGSTGKINPPHGQPGHDCAVPVGSPLPG